jgi:hypothetical protein
MKVYLVWETTYHMPYPTQRLMGVYETSQSAKKRTDELNEANLCPMEADEYGPYGGVEYKYHEKEVQA